MSKNPFSGIKNNIKKSKHKIAVRLGVVENSVDGEFDNLSQRFEHISRVSKDSVKHFKTVTDHFSAFSTSLDLVMKDMLETYDYDDPMTTYLKRMGQIVDQWDKAVSQGFEKQMQERCSDPLLQYRLEFDAVRDGVKKREITKMDYDARHSEVKKLAEKMDQKDPAKLTKAKDKMREKEEQYRAESMQAKQQMADVLTRKPGAHDPIVEGFMTNMMYLAQEMTKLGGQMKALVQEAKNANVVAHRKPIVIQEEPVLQYYDDDNAGDDDNTPPPSSSSSMTRSAPPAMPGSRGAAAAAAVDPEFDCEWFYLDANVQQQGPVDYAKLRQMYKSGTIDDQTHVFGADMSEWAIVSSMAKLRLSLSN